MAITTVNVNTSNTTVYTSTNDTAVTFMSLCNHTGSSVTVDVNIVPNGVGVSDSNIFLDTLTITGGDTYVLYSGGEKILFNNGDFISVIAGTASAITAITSYVEI
jgi:hypothetical protein